MMNSTKFIFGILALLLVVNFASAALTISAVSAPTNVSEFDSSLTYSFNVTNTEASNLTVSFSGSTNVSGVSFNSISPVLVNSGQTVSVTGSVSGITSRGNQAVLVSFSASNASITDSDSFQFSIISAGLCNNGVNSSIHGLEISDESNLDDEWEWRPLDDIEIDVDFDTDFDSDDDYDYTVNLLLFKYENGKWIDVSDDLVDDEDLLEQDINNLDGGDDDTATFNFKVDGDLDDGNYKLVAKVVQDEPGKACNFVEAEQEISIDKEDSYAIVSDVQGENSFSCGQTVDLTAVVSNIGSQDEDQVKVILYNKELGLNVVKEIQNLDESDSADVSFTFQIPTSVQEKLYKVTFSTEFDYDDRDDDYNEQSDSDDDYTYSFNVLGNCVDKSKPTITASLKSDAVVGQEMIVELSIRNNGDSDLSFLTSATGYDSWATLNSVNPSPITVSKATTGIVTLTLTPNKSGQQTFNVRGLYGSQIIDQPITVNVAEKSGAISGLFSGVKGSATNYLIAGIIILVVLIVIILIVKAVRKD